MSSSAVMNQPSSAAAARGNPIRIGLLGCGTVGCGVVCVLARNGEEIARRVGRRLQIYRVGVRSPGKLAPLLAENLLAHDAIVDDLARVVDDPAIDIICELIGGTTLARALVLRAIARGKHVVTANKALLALHGDEIFTAAQAAGVMVAFEAAVAGGVPIIKTLREGLSANRIEWLAGIINGTSNYILSEMQQRGLPFAQALAEAQKLGYAEADPTFDIEGHDAAHKLTLLAAIAFGMPMRFGQVYREGIAQLARVDIAYAEQLGYRIKLLGIARQRAAGIELRVHPTLVPAQSAIAHVEGVLNAVLVQGDAVGQVLCSGRGAGAEPTASAVLADLVDVSRLATADPEHRVPHLAFQPNQLSTQPVLPIDAVVCAHYLRLTVCDRAGVLADLTRILADHAISIEALLQMAAPAPQPDVVLETEGLCAPRVEIILLTHEAEERQIRTALARIEALPAVSGPATHLRVERFAAEK